MKVFAYCALAFIESMRRVAGVEPVTCPPMTADDFDPKRLENHGLLLFDFHGLPGADYWYAESTGPGGIPERIVALRADQVRQADLSGTMVFALSCYLGDPDNPMRQAFLDAGAQYVIGGAGENWAGQQRVMGAADLARWFRILAPYMSPVKALEQAKWFLRLRGDTPPNEDALAFQAFRKEDST